MTTAKERPELHTPETDALLAHIWAEAKRLSAAFGHETPATVGEDGWLYLRHTWRVSCTWLIPTVTGNENRGFHVILSGRHTEVEAWRSKVQLTYVSYENDGVMSDGELTRVLNLVFSTNQEQPVS